MMLMMMTGAPTLRSSEYNSLELAWIEETTRCMPLQHSFIGRHAAICLRRRKNERKKERKKAKKLVEYGDYL